MCQWRGCDRSWQCRRCRGKIELRNGCKGGRTTQAEECTAQGREGKHPRVKTIFALPRSKFRIRSPFLSVSFILLMWQEPMRPDVTGGLRHLSLTSFDTKKKKKKIVKKKKVSLFCFAFILSFKRNQDSTSAECIFRAFGSRQ